MIFVTVGTHEQQFDRLLKEVDTLKRKKIIKEDVLIQSGFCDYQPQYCETQRFLPYEDMRKNIEKARIVITHGGPASFLMVLKFGKVPIVVPRKAKFNEHINNHQVEFTKNIESRMKNIIGVYDISKLGEVISNYDELVLNLNQKAKSNNDVFNEKFKEIVADLFKV